MILIIMCMGGVQSFSRNIHILCNTSIMFPLLTNFLCSLNINLNKPVHTEVFQTSPK